MNDNGKIPEEIYDALKELYDGFEKCLKLIRDYFENN